MMRLLILLFALLLSVPTSNAQTTTETERQPVRFDRNHSTLGFNVPIVNGLSKVTGKFTDFSITLFWDEADLAASSVSVEIKAESIDTGIDGRNEHLRSDDFFNVAEYPTLTFESSSIQADGDGYLVSGTFTMMGVSQEISFPLTKEVFSTDTATWTAFRIAYTLDRTDYGMDWKHSIAEFFVGDEIETDIVLLTR